ncbi:cell adhesion molecule CEACAM21-like isoform X1 [Panthera onca]
MEPPSALPRGGRVPWQELLLAVSLLTFWNPPTTAQVTVELVPPNAAEGKDVLLRVHNLPVNLLGFGWFKGETVEPRSEIVSYAADSQEITPGLAHSGRETLYHNGSLLFQNINLEDTGYYTVRILKRNFQIEIVTRRLRVYQAVSQPSINISNTTATEHKDSVVLTCSTNNTGVSIWWFFNNQSLKLTERMKLSPDNSTLTISPVRVGHAGNYQCEVSNPVSSSKSDPVRLAVSWPVANVITERWGTQPAPLVMVQSAAPHPRTPYPARGQPFPSTRTYNTLTGTFTARSTTKDKCLLSFPFPWELLLPGAFLRPQTLGGVRCRRLSQRTSSKPRGYSGTWTQGPGLPDFWKP